MQIVSRGAQNSWWLLAGTAGMLLAAVVGPQLAQPALDVRWTGVVLLAALGGITTALVGPVLLPLAVARGRRLRPLTQGFAVGVVAAGVMAAGVSVAPDILAPVEVRVGHGIPDLLLNQLQWAVPAAGVAGAVLGLAAWAVLAERDAVRALARLVGGAGWAAAVVWGAAAANLVASVLTATLLAQGSAGAGSVAERMAAVRVAGTGWSVAWAAWALASVALVGVLALLAQHSHPRWRPLALAAATVAVTADLVAVTVLAVAVPALAGGAPQLFVATERTALVLSGLGGNLLYGTVGLVLVRAAGRRLHPVVGLTGTGAFAAAICSGVALVAVPGWIAPVVGVSIGLFVVFALGYGWQLAASRRVHPGLEDDVRRAARALVPLHPVPFVAAVDDLAVVAVEVDAGRLSELLPLGLRTVDGPRTTVTVLAGTLRGARPAGLPEALGLPPTPAVLLRVQVVDEAGREAATFLRGWADDTLAAVATHWLTEFQLSRIDLRLSSDGERWRARGSAGSLEIGLVAADGAGVSDGTLGGHLVVERGRRTAEVDLSLDGGDARPATVSALRVPFLERLRPRVLRAAVVGTATIRTGRARWR